MKTDRQEVTEEQRCAVVLVDVAGTTTSHTFIEDTLYKYVDDNLEEFVKTSLDSIKELINELRAAAVTEATTDNDKQTEDAGEENDAASEQKTNGSTGDELTAEETVAIIKQSMRDDSSNETLKRLQGRIYKKGYEDGTLKGHVYSDVSTSFAKWSRTKKIGIFSSGSVDAQTMLFRHTSDGDLTEYIGMYFDQRTIGLKTSKDSYKKIADAFEVPPEEIMFISDDIEEIKAAKQANLQVTLIRRDGNDEPTTEESYRVIKSFKDLKIVAEDDDAQQRIGGEDGTKVTIEQDNDDEAVTNKRKKKKEDGAEDDGDEKSKAPKLRKTEVDDDCEKANGIAQASIDVEQQNVGGNESTEAAVSMDVDDVVTSDKEKKDDGAKEQEEQRPAKEDQQKTSENDEKQDCNNKTDGSDRCSESQETKATKTDRADDVCMDAVEDVPNSKTERTTSETKQANDAKDIGKDSANDKDEIKSDGIDNGNTPEPVKTDEKESSKEESDQKNPEDKSADEKVESSVTNNVPDAKDNIVNGDDAKKLPKAEDGENAEDTATNGEGNECKKEETKTDNKPPKAIVDGVQCKEEANNLPLASSSTEQQSEATVET